VIPGLSAVFRWRVSLWFPLSAGNALYKLLHPLGALPLHLIRDVTVHVQREGSGGMAQVALHRLDVISTPDRGDGVAVPIGYNKDKSGIPVFSRGLRFVLILFPSIFPQKIGISRGAKK